MSIPLTANLTSANILIVGAGPAGIAAALTLARQQRSSVLFGDGVYRNGRAEQHQHGHSAHGAPSNFSQAARNNILANYDQFVTFYDTTVTRVDRLASGFVATDIHGIQYHGRKLILASGVEDIPLPIDGYTACFGRVIFHCLLCQGYDQRGGATAGVLAMDAFARVAVALHVARQAASLVTQAVTVYTNGDTRLADEVRQGVGDSPVFFADSRVIRRFVFLGDQDQAHGGGIRIEFVDGSVADESFLAHAPETRPRGNFIEQLSLATTVHGDIYVELPHYRTSVPDVFAAGDNCARMKSVAHAMLSGNVAGMGAAQDP
ncbi:hypothetical protein SEUCBS139899_002889 [Sporothrix eucalyptigena]|uniref:FAD/NAD(P)-binding domain-containing protein n=1 Tax=Sporothrix eucalyptigena TaxID=1812306 RepID=A0ABP0BZ75_9PEZI